MKIHFHFLSAELVALAAVMIFSSSRSLANNSAWLGGTNGDWENAANWSAGVPTGTANGNNVYFNAQSTNEVVTFSAPANASTLTNYFGGIIFQGTGYGYTIGSLSSTNGFIIPAGRTIVVQATLAASNTTETIAAPIEAQGAFVLQNYSPETSTGLSVRGVGGYGNLLLVSGNITEDAATQLSVLGAGDIIISGNILNANGATLAEDSMGTLTLSGSNTYTGKSSFGGKVVLDYTTNNTSKISSSAALALGTSFNGGHLVVKGNALSATTQNAGSTTVQAGGNSIEVDGNSGAVATLNLKAITVASAGALVDFNTNANGVITTTNSNAGSGATATGILGPWATFAQTYWATVSGGTIVGLTTDNGSAFNNKNNNFTVTSGGQTLNFAALGANEGANTVRFISGGALDLGGGVLNMAYGGVLVASGVTTNTTIQNGSLNVLNAGSNGFDLYNYGTGTLTISANMATNVTIAKAGSGNVVLSGNNSAVFSQQIDILSGKLTMGSVNALGASTYTGAPAYGIGNNIVFGDGTATLDLNGFNLYASTITSDTQMTPGNQAAAAGLNPQIINSKAGTVSTIRVAGTNNITTANQAPTTSVGNSSTIPNLGGYYGGLNEASGAILAIDIEKGTATGEVQFQLGSANPYGDPTGFNSTAASGLVNANEVFTGAITVGVGANLGLSGWSDYETTGVLTLNGIMGANNSTWEGFAVGYLTGTGSFGTAVPTYLDVDTRGTVADSFAGNFFNATGQAMILFVDGTGTLSLVNSGVFSINVAGVTTTGTSTLTLPGVTNASALSLQGESTMILTGTSGTVGGGTLFLYGSKLTVAPSGSGAAVSVNSVGSQFWMDGTAEIVLDKGNNASLTYTMGSIGAGFATVASGEDSAFVLGSAQGLAALGTTDKFIILSNAGATPVNLRDGIYVPSNPNAVNTAAYAQNATAGGPMDATFLTYTGTGTTSDTGFTPYVFTAATTNSASTTWASTKEELITSANGVQTLNTSFPSVFGLEIDKGASLALNGGTLLLGDTAVGEGYVILNGASITGTGSLSMVTNAHFYTDLDNGTISTLITGNFDVAKDGPGTLFITTFSGDSTDGLPHITVNQGALDLGKLDSSTGIWILHGGVIQGHGLITRQLSAVAGGVILGSDGTNALGGGFSARGGLLQVTLVDATGSKNLVWGVTSAFLQEGSVLNFGSLTSDSEVNLTNNMDFGPAGNLGFGAAGNGNGLYSRVISVTANASDTGDLLATSDFTLLSGVLSSNSNPYAGLTKTGTGALVLSGVNTYTGATTISQGMIEIFADSGLGTAPTAAYGLNVSPGISGNALTAGAIEINGGASLGVDGLGQGVTINANRQMLLASGSTGATAALIDVAGGSMYGYYTTMNFGGIIADYVNEMGSLEKQGGGTFNYSGTAYNTGFFAVTNGTLMVSGGGSVNGSSGITINNESTDANATAQFNYASTVGLSKTVSFGAGGGVFAYNSAAAYTGASTMTITTGQTVAGAGNLSQTALTIGNGGTITPGNINGQAVNLNKQFGTATVGALTTGAAKLLNGGNYNFLLADVNGAAGIGYSTVNASSVDLSALSASFSLNLESLNGTTPGAPANFNTFVSYDFVLFTTGAGGITAQTQAQLNAEFAIHVLPNDGATGFTSNGSQWSVYENANDSELILHYSAVPEPDTWAMLLGGVGLLVFIRRLRRRTA